MTAKAAGRRKRLKTVAAKRDESVVCKLDEARRDFPEIPGWELLEKSGQGGMGTVYKARRKTETQTSCAEYADTERYYAVKVMNERIADAVTRKRFETEARASAELTSCSLISVYAWGITDEARAFIVMDYFDAESLASYLAREGRLSLQDFYSIFSQVLEALEVVHDAKIIHRDLKPSNIMLRREENGELTAKIVDFGIARLIPQATTDEMRITQTGEVLGSPVYMSPEQCTGGHLDERSDIYSLACVMFEALSGQPPFLGDNVVLTILKHLNVKPQSIKELRARSGSDDVPTELDEIIARCLEKEADARYQDIADLRNAFSALDDRTPVLARKEYQKELKLQRKRKALVRIEKRFAPIVFVLSLILTACTILSMRTDQEAEYRRLVEAAEMKDSIAIEDSIDLWRKATAEAERLHLPFRTQGLLHYRLGRAIQRWGIHGRYSNSDASKEFSRALWFYDSVPQYEIERLLVMQALTESMLPHLYKEPPRPKEIKKPDDELALSRMKDASVEPFRPDLKLSGYEDAIWIAKDPAIKLQAFKELRKEMLKQFPALTPFAQHSSRAKIIQYSFPGNAELEYLMALSIEPDARLGKSLRELYSDQEVFDEDIQTSIKRALPILAYELEMEERLLPKEHARPIYTATRMAGYLHRAGELEQAEFYYKKALKMTEKHRALERSGFVEYGTGQGDKLAVDYADCLAFRGDLKEAAKVYAKQLSSIEATPVIPAVDENGKAYEGNAYCYNRIRQRLIDALILSGSLDEAAKEISRKPTFARPKVPTPREPMLPSVYRAPKSSE